MLVGHLGPGGDDLPDEGAEAADVLLGEGPVGGVGEVAGRAGATGWGRAGTSRGPIGLFELGVVGKHPPMLGPVSRGVARHVAGRLEKLIRMVNDEHDRPRPDLPEHPPDPRGAGPGGRRLRAGRPGTGPGRFRR